MVVLLILFVGIFFLAMVVFALFRIVLDRLNAPQKEMRLKIDALEKRIYQLEKKDK